jgi:hypothetical protein
MSALYLEGTAALMLAACAVWLARWTRCVRPDESGSRRALAIVATAGVLSLVRVNGISAARLVLTLSPSLSVTTLALSLTAISSGVWGRPMIPRSEWPVLGGFVLLISVPLFWSVLGLWPVDLYALGYRFSWLYVVVAVLGAFVAWRGQTASALMILAAMVVQYASPLPSRNLFDALTDGVAFLAAVALVGRAVAGWIASRRRCPV